VLPDVTGVFGLVAGSDERQHGHASKQQGSARKIHGYMNA
jgi:hypothetical protein